MAFVGVFLVSSRKSSVSRHIDSRRFVGLIFCIPTLLPPPPMAKSRVITVVKHSTMSPEMEKHAILTAIDALTKYTVGLKFEINLL
jgi:hypothetical protein